VKVDEASYTLPTVLRAVDVAIKTYFVLNLQYDPVSINIYTFLQKFVYSIETVHDRISPSVATLLKEVSDIQK
jgi:hypothetical protein